jgi:hypothetical protein
MLHSNETSPLSKKRTFLKKGVTFFTVLFAVIGFVLVVGYFAVRYGFTNTNGIIDTQTQAFIKKTNTASEPTYTSFPLAHTNEWIAFRQAVAKDLPTIKKVSKETNVPERLLVAILVPEQMRLFYTNRDIFKSFFAPLKVLGSQSQFSWGIFGIKDDTARAVELHLIDTKSPFYLGPSFEKSLSFSSITASSTSIDQERFARITDEHNHYYGYLYAALYVRQIEAQWKKSGYSITTKPEVIATLWNLGFERSKPHANPSSGGAAIDIDGKEYSFGELARLFYYSDEMIELFPIADSK